MTTSPETGIVETVPAVKEGLPSSLSVQKHGENNGHDVAANIGIRAEGTAEQALSCVAQAVAPSADNDEVSRVVVTKSGAAAGPGMAKVSARKAPRRHLRNESAVVAALMANATTGNGSGADTGKPDSSPDGLGNNDGGSGGDGPKKKPGSGEHTIEIIEPNDELREIVQWLKDRGFESLKAVALVDANRAQLKFRREFWDGDIQDDIRRIQASEQTLEANDPYGWYNLRKYRGGRITIGNSARVLGYESPFDILFTESGDPKNVLEIGPGNGDLIRGLEKLLGKVTSDAARLRFVDELLDNGQTRISVNRIRESVLEHARTNVDIDKVNPHLLAIDFVPGFCRSLQKMHIAAIPGDICGTTDELFRAHTLEKTGDVISLEPNSIDVVIMNFIADRVTNLRTAIQNIRKMARKTTGKDRTRFMMGGSFPFGPISDSDSKRVNIPQVKFWEPQGDMREKWVGDSSDPLARKKAVKHAVFDLARAGLMVDTMAVQPTYEAYSTHCIIEPAAVLRREYTREEMLEKFRGTDFEKSVNDVFDGKIPDTQVVAFPQIYKDVYLFGGYVNPWEEDAA